MPRDHDDELKREIQAHLELEAEERVADGMSEADAHYARHRGEHRDVLGRQRRDPAAARISTP